MALRHTGRPPFDDLRPDETVLMEDRADVRVAGSGRTRKGRGRLYLTESRIVWQPDLVTRCSRWCARSA